MKFEKNDPRLIAYVLNELAPAERALMTSAIAADPALQAEVAALQQTMGLFRGAFSAEMKNALLPEQREKVLSGGKKEKRSLRGFWLGLTGLTVGLVSLVLILKMQPPDMNSEVSAIKGVGGMAEGRAEIEDTNVAAEIGQEAEQSDAPAARSAELHEPRRNSIGEAAKLENRSEGERAGAFAGAAAIVKPAADAMPAQTQAKGVAKSSAIKKQKGRRRMSIVSRYRTKALISEKEASAVLLSLKPMFQDCLKQRLEKPGGVHGQIVMQLVIPPDGSGELSSKATTTSFHDVPLEQCLSDAIRSKGWPTAPKGVTVFDITLDIDSD